MHVPHMRPALLYTPKKSWPSADASPQHLSRLSQWARFTRIIFQPLFIDRDPRSLNTVILCIIHLHITSFQYSSGFFRVLFNTKSKKSGAVLSRSRGSAVVQEAVVWLPSISFSLLQKPQKDRNHGQVQSPGFFVMLLWNA